mmetsp:Transcript_14857/g.37222  ORF Transcript_14857/g.37222 Transcript_14857/m.37222 type:complete len:398 (+) Transcript_14857:179-1372(+)|eukprot:CAMPEP_0173440986 /NCGR_PEP_ID=MMETSP1357-20121228/23714_1 /TAXON_ID=77926 /ORGANISM="Hemiselmis rufescens, Strain PCC563" /LENGTH=397 /DNA_ID=CAMNT_0014406531 /DNA_START=158 /DNA_END=1351 /DNA_ORIENTATION=+
MVQSTANGSGMLLGLALLGQLIGTGDSFSIPSAVYPRAAAWGSIGRGRVCPSTGFAERVLFRPSPLDTDTSSQRNRRVAALSMAFNSPTHHFPSLLEDPLSLLRAVPLPFAKPASGATPADFTAHGVAVEEEAASDGEKFHAAALSSKLTLDFYFRNLQRSTSGGGASGLRFDEISSFSNKRTLLKFADERDIALDDAQDPSAMYEGIVSALQGGGRSVKTGPCRRIERFVEYGKLNPMPNRDASQPEGEDMRAVLAAYGAQDEGHMHFSIEAVLKLMDVEYKTDYTVHNGEMYTDFILEGLGPNGGKFLLTARDKKSFMEGTQEVSNYCKMKAKSVKGIGYSVVAVPYFEWDKLTTNGQKAAYLAGRLSRAGFFGEGEGITGESASRVQDAMRKTH